MDGRSPQLSQLRSTWSGFIGVFIIVSFILVLVSFILRSQSRSSTASRRSSRQRQRFDNSIVRQEPQHMESVATSIEVDNHNSGNMSKRRISTIYKPSWKEEGELATLINYTSSDGDSIQNFEISGPQSLEAAEPKIQIGDALKGNTNDDALSGIDSRGFFGRLRDKAHKKFPKLPYIFPYEPPLIALGSDSDSDSDLDTGNSEKTSEDWDRDTTKSSTKLSTTKVVAATAVPINNGSKESLADSIDVTGQGNLLLPGPTQDLSVVTSNGDSVSVMGARAIVPSLAF